MNNVEETMKKLRPGDRVRVTREQDVLTVSPSQPSGISMKDGPNITRYDPTIISIEVIDRPLAVHDRVRLAYDNEAGTITALDTEHAIVLWDDVDRCPKNIAALKDLKRV